MKNMKKLIKEGQLALLSHFKQHLEYNIHLLLEYMIDYVHLTYEKKEDHIIIRSPAAGTRYWVLFSRERQFCIRTLKFLSQFISAFVDQINVSHINTARKLLTARYINCCVRNRSTRNVPKMNAAEQNV